jgi:universal stress protein A
MRKIVVGTDFSELATAALRVAADLAAKTGAELIIVYADPFEPPAEFTSREIADVAQSIEASKRLAGEELTRYVAASVPPGIKWRASVIEGFPAAVIRDIADKENADLIAVGTHGRTGLQRLLLGSVAEELMRTAKVPVLTARMPVAVSA